MKNDPTATFLNFVLAALVILGVLFALLSIKRTHNLRQMQPLLQTHAQKYQLTSMKVQALYNDAVTYNVTAKNQELAQIIQTLQTQAPAPAK